MAISWSQSLAWRLRRQHLDPVGTDSVEDVVRRLAGVQSGDVSATELAVRTRRTASAPGEVEGALVAGRLIKTFAFRGSTHLLTPEEGGIYLALRASSRMWELPSWRSYYGVEPADWPAIRELARAAMADGPVTVKELIAAISKPPRFRHLAAILAGNPWSFVKALAWHGDLSFGALRGRQTTLQRLDGNPRWAGLPDVEDAGPLAIEAYLGAYGPATLANLQYWLGSGLGAGKRIPAWLNGLRKRVADLEIEGSPALLLREHLDDLASARPTRSIRLLPAYDQWVLGPGTADARVVPSARRALVSRGANVVVAGGVVAGTWTIRDAVVSVDWFADFGRPPRAGIDEELARLASILDLRLEVVVKRS